MNDVMISAYQEGLKELRTNLANMLPAEMLEIFDTDAQALQKNHQDVLKLKMGDQLHPDQCGWQTGQLVQPPRARKSSADLLPW